jgi:2-polyprenyl-3-methyl-5-hydroxy-6-metoxy-1,4-benzoquinol methylase
MLSDETLHKIVTKIIKLPPQVASADIHPKITKILGYKTVAPVEKLARIDAILADNDIKQPIASDRQNFIFDRVGKYMHTHLKLGPQTRVLDIGGGNGNFLSYLGTTYGLPKKNLVCLEQRPPEDTAAFHYAFDNTNMTYAFWDDPPKGEFDIIICMVVLHHIPDAAIADTVMPFIDAHIAPAGYLLIKEHDSRSQQTVAYINWEHHLYYLLEHTRRLSAAEIGEYLAGFVANYKSFGDFCALFREHRFKMVRVFNNIFDPQTVGFRNNSPTKLYWALFQRRGAGAVAATATAPA